MEILRFQLELSREDGKLCLVLQCHRRHTHMAGWWLSSDVPSCITEPPNECHPLSAGISHDGCSQSWVVFKETSKPPRRANESPSKNARWALIYRSEAHPRGEEGMKGGLFCTRVLLGDGPRLPAMPTLDTELLLTCYCHHPESWGKAGGL